MAFSAIFFVLGLNGNDPSNGSGSNPNGYLLREDGSYMLREDGSRFALE